MKDSGNHLPSSEIQTDTLASPENVVMRYHKLAIESKIHTLALKLAVESFFGVNVMSRCTPLGCSKHKGLPVIELNRLKLILFCKLPKFWSSHDFEPLWSRCLDSIGHACTRYR